MCDIEVFPPIGIDEFGNTIGVAGTVSDCPEDPVEGTSVAVEVTCADETAERSADVFSDGRWYAEFPNLGCRCGRPVTATATCTTVEGCTDTVTVDELSCIDCSGHGTDDDVNLPPFTVEDRECLITGNAAIPIEILFTNTLGEVVNIDIQCGQDAVAGGAVLEVQPGATLTDTVACEFETPSPAREIVIWYLDADMQPIGCPPVVLVVDEMEECPCQTDEIPDYTVAVDGCTATFTRTALPEGCSIIWNFDDDSSFDTDSDVSVEHEYPENDTYNPSATMKCGDCPYPISLPSVEITDCESDDDDGSGGNGNGDGSGGNGDDTGGGGEGLGCALVRTGLAVSMAIVLLAGLLALCIPAAAEALGLVALGAGITAIVLGLVYWFVCDEKACQFVLLTASQASLGAGVAALILSGCCFSVMIAGVVLVFAGLAGLQQWKVKCNKTNCHVTREISLVVAGIVLPLVGMILQIPLLEPCRNHVWEAIIAVAVAGVTIHLGNCFVKAVDE